MVESRADVPEQLRVRVDLPGQIEELWEFYCSFSGLVALVGVSTVATVFGRYRSLAMSTAPVSSVTAVAAEPGSISGTPLGASVVVGNGFSVVVDGKSVVVTKDVVLGKLVVPGKKGVVGKNRVVPA
jgi:hypothetical protein